MDQPREHCTFRLVCKDRKREDDFFLEGQRLFVVDFAAPNKPAMASNTTREGQPKRKTGEGLRCVVCLMPLHRSCGAVTPCAAFSSASPIRHR